ncbi:carbon-nitrogen hydrolase family protein [Sedimentibacter sp. zth1]|uniref:carbon-nitrogen hydrolase family protein n=1 Tax=Sedimentibacter sp. zth1 TaxID=2816908 RepID=UPI001A90DC8B|nr:carbon-nitrogen hydrolase family protein [Sedimentibacter sp. zth1]QSX07385.1 carbon-nitrogen hydrolase family protein [Sedimentibacter sp. zth1]
MKLGIIQSNIYEDKKLNVNNAIKSINSLALQGADIIILPEMFNCPYKNYYFKKYAESINGFTYNAMSNSAKNNNVYLVAGSIPEKEGEKIYNTSFIFDRQGHLISKHRKAHLFDIDVEGGQHFKESDTLTAGDSSTVFETEFCKIGVCICYDIRFPELSRNMVLDGARIIIVPAAFNMTTGPAHWELLFRQRAADNQVFTVGVAPARDINSSYISYGNSIIASPWGNIVHRLDEKEQSAVVEIDLGFIDKVRNELPLLKHRKPKIYKL